MELIYMLVANITKWITLIAIIALVIFDEDLDAEETALKIKRYRKELKKTENFEFKFSKCSRDIKLEYFKKIQNSDYENFENLALMPNVRNAD